MFALVVSVFSSNVRIFNDEKQGLLDSVFPSPTPSLYPLSLPTDIPFSFYPAPTFLSISLYLFSLPIFRFLSPFISSLSSPSFILFYLLSEGDTQLLPSPFSCAIVTSFSCLVYVNVTFYLRVCLQRLLTEYAFTPFNTINENLRQDSKFNSVNPTSILKIFYQYTNDAQVRVHR